MLYDLVRPFLFRLPPEAAHRLVFALLGVLERRLERRGPPPVRADPALAQSLWGLDFPNPVGLAAGLDKNAELPLVWGRLGFGFAELGTVTAHAQCGNPRPRLFRLPEDRAFINRLGFNNDGAPEVASRLARRLARRRSPIPLGINLGKSRVTPIEQAAADYKQSLEAVFPLADYVVVNVSSPNTPGLRDLQSANQLGPLLSDLRAANRAAAERLGCPPRPLLVKLSPDLSDAELTEVAGVAEREGAAGLIATNTTLARPPLRTRARVAAEPGGLSGGPLAERALAVLRTLHRSTGGRLPIVAVGGIFDADDAYARIRAGASLVQVYTAFVYEGPDLPRRINDGLLARLRREGHARLGDAVGSESRLDRPGRES